MENLLSLANYNIATKKSFDGYLQASSAKQSNYEANYPNPTVAGVGAYAQASLKVTLTDQGVHIYSPPNHDGRASSSGGANDTWGGICFSPMKTQKCLIEGHRYIILWHCIGQTSTALTDTTWTNQIGWGQSPDAAPTVNRRCVPAEGFQGSMECCYDFTINDTVFKTTGSTVHSGFEANTSYLAYAGFKIGFGYRQTGELGTDLYLSNFRMYDITNATSANFTKTGDLKVAGIVELPDTSFSNAQILSSGDLITRQIIEY